MQVNLADIAQQTLQLALQHGADAADVMLERSENFEVKVADKHIINLTQATAKGLGVRVFVNQRMGFCTTCDFSHASLVQATQRAVAMAHVADADPYNGITSIPTTSTDTPFDTYDRHVIELSVEQKIAMAHEMEEAARSSQPHIKKFSDSGVATSITETILVNSNHIFKQSRATDISLWCTPVAERDGQLQTDVWYDSQTHLADLESTESIGRTAAARATRMLGARAIATQNIPVIFEPAMAINFIAAMITAINGDMVHKRASFLSDKLGALIAASALVVIDDPHMQRAPHSSLFDGEGMPTYLKKIIDTGRLTTFLYDGYTARKAGVTPTASAKRSFVSTPHAGVFNFYVAPGTVSKKDICNIPRALLITRGLGRGLNHVSGEYSRGVNGLWLEHGEIVHAVQEVTIAGDYITMLQNIDAIANDLHLRGGSGAPSLRINNVTVSGA